MFRLLVPRFQEGIYQADSQGDIALVQIIMNSSASQNRYESARILLSQSGADWNSHSWDGQQNPLRAAVQLGDLDMCCLLIYTDNMNPRSALACDSEGKMCLRDESPEKENMLQILQFLCTRVNITSTSAQW